MKRSEVAMLLAKMQAYDNRTVGEANVTAWYEQFADVELADAAAAVARHYNVSRDMAMPADILDHVAVIVAERVAEQRAAERARALERPVPVPTDRSAQVIAKLRSSLPAGRPDKLRGMHWLAENPGASRNARIRN